MSVVPARIRGVAAHLPATVVSSAEAEARVIERSAGFRPRPGAIRKLTGIDRRHVAGDDERASDLAVAAAAKVLADQGLSPGDLDLIVFGAASHDVLEPATAHVVAAKLGARCPVFDVKNACNSFLNAMQVAEALIATGQHRRVLVCAGETGSRVVRWQVADRAEFVDSFPGYTLSDAGAALVLEASARPGIRYRTFGADSTAWNISTVAGTGAAHLRDPRHDGYIRGSGRSLKEAVLGVDLRAFLDEALAAAGLTRADIAVFCMHQVAVPYVRVVREAMAVPAEKLVLTIVEHGNVASCSLPLQLSIALESGRCGPGDTVALIGLAGGVSLGLMFVEL